MSTSPAETANHFRVLILGSGPAGLTAALYAARAGLAPLVLDGTQPGGQLTITTDVENFPGFADGILGPELVENMRKQAQRFGSTVRFEQATKVTLDKSPFTVETDEGSYTCDSLIIATGAKAKLLGLESEMALMGHGVSACATCDGFFFKGKEIVVVGGGDSAMEEAIYLTRFASKVTIVHRRTDLRASKIMAERARKNPKIEWQLNKEVLEVVGSREKGVSAIKLRDVDSCEETLFPTQGFFLAIGHEPNTGLFADALEMDEKRYLVVAHPTTRTRIEGVFACGDVMDPSYRQAVTAAGTGCQAALDAERWLEAREHH